MAKRILLLVLALALSCFAGLTVFLYSFDGGGLIPSFGHVKGNYKSSYAKLLDRNGEVIHEQRVDFKIRKRDWTSLKDISPALIKAVIASEDKRFYSHGGVDYISLIKAFVTNFFYKHKRGASTITMQLVFLADMEKKRNWKRRTLWQKVKQIKKAIKLENTWTKKEILESYLNLVSFRGEVVGIEAASRELFHKMPSGLDSYESSVLASLIRSPNADIDKVVNRACLLDELITAKDRCKNIKNIIVSRLSVPYYWPTDTFYAPHAANALLKGEIPKTRTLQTTIDGGLQRFAISSLKHHLQSLAKKNVQEGAVLVIDNKSGEILAYVGNSWSDSEARYVCGVKAKRQAGSTLKPFLYALGFDKKLLTSSSILLDEPINVPTVSGTYRPRNYDNRYRGPVAVKVALASSLNIPAVRTLSLIGPDAFVDKLSELGFNPIRDGKYFGLSLALGSMEVSLLELVNAYRTLANGGVFSETTMSPKDKVDGKAVERRIYSKGSAFITTMVLSDRPARSTTFNLENSLSTRFFSAVKTGTSKNMRDNWCVGFSEHYSVGVWVGNFDGSEMENVSGISGAAPLWLDIMRYLHRFKKSEPPQPPDNVEEMEVVFAGTKDKHWFIKGTGNKRVVFNQNVYEPKILYPAYGTVIALDPDIPDYFERVSFERTNADRSVSWVIDDVTIGLGKTMLWQPTLGKHTLKLVSGDGTLLDKVVFFVR